MPLTPRRGLRLLAATLGLAALSAAPAQAKGAIANPYDCKPNPTLTQPFAPFNDLGLYTPVANQGFEAAATSWMLAGGAAVVGGNEPWKVAGAADSHALDLPSGSSAVTSPICIDQTYPYFRLFALNAGSGKRSLEIDVLLLRHQGQAALDQAVRLRDRCDGLAADADDRDRRLGQGPAAAAAPVAFRFMPKGKDAHFLIDDVLVDPYARAR